MIQHRRKSFAFPSLSRRGLVLEELDELIFSWSWDERIEGVVAKEGVELACCEDEVGFGLRGEGGDELGSRGFEFSVVAGLDRDVVDRFGAEGGREENETREKSA